MAWLHQVRALINLACGADQIDGGDAVQRRYQDIISDKHDRETDELDNHKKRYQQHVV